MFPSVIRTYLVSLFIVIVSNLAFGQDRKIISELNHGCLTCTTTDITLIYIKAIGSHDSVHQIWDFTKGVPTVIFAIASVNSTLDVIWNETLPQDFVMSETPKYSFGAAIDKIIEYEDIEDSGQISANDSTVPYPLWGVSWLRDELVQTDDEVMVRLSGSFKQTEQWQQGALVVKLDLLPFRDYAVDLPHLIHTSNSTLVDVQLVNMTTAPMYNASRFALRMLLVSTDIDDSMRLVMRKSLDDEHTPGVFEIIEIKTPETMKRGDGGFMQFRPVAYTQPERGVTTSTLLHVSEFNKSQPSRDSTLHLFFKKWESRRELLAQNMLVSFGEPGDGYYKQHNYTAWSFTIGYGTPPMEGFSFFVISIISIGLGVPVVLALSGVVFVVTKRCRQRNVPTRFTDEE